VSVPFYDHEPETRDVLQPSAYQLLPPGPLLILNRWKW
jgi:hypothetical protein